MLLIRSVAVVLLAAINVRTIDSAFAQWGGPWWSTGPCITHGSAPPGARETCGVARGRVLNARSAKLDLLPSRGQTFFDQDLSQGVLELTRW